MFAAPEALPVATNSLRRKEIINEGREGIRQEMKVRWWGDKGARGVGKR